MTTATIKTKTLAGCIERATGRRISQADARTLRRAEMTLRRWAEQEYGVEKGRVGWKPVAVVTRCSFLERDENTGTPYIVTYPLGGESYRRRTPDREASALKRVRAICDRVGLHWHHQADPHRCTLYVSDQPLTDTNYTSGVGCSI